MGNGSSSLDEEWRAFSVEQQEDIADLQLKVATLFNPGTELEEHASRASKPQGSRTELGSADPCAPRLKQNNEESAPGSRLGFALPPSFIAGDLAGDPDQGGSGGQVIRDPVSPANLSSASALNRRLSAERISRHNLFGNSTAEPPVRPFYGTGPMQNCSLPGRKCPSVAGGFGGSASNRANGPDYLRSNASGAGGQGADLHRVDFENCLLGRNPREVPTDNFTIPDPPNHPMQFGRWTEQVYMAVANSIPRRNEEALQWTQMVENVADVEMLRETEPFTNCDSTPGKILASRMHGPTAV